MGDTAETLVRSHKQDVLPEPPSFDVHGSCTTSVVGDGFESDDEVAQDIVDLPPALSPLRTPTPVFGVRNAAADVLHVEVPSQWYIDAEGDRTVTGRCVKQACLDKLNELRKKDYTTTGSTNSAAARGEMLLKKLSLPPSMVELVIDTSACTESCATAPIKFCANSDGGCDHVEIDATRLRLALEENKGMSTISLCQDVATLLVRCPAQRGPGDAHRQKCDEEAVVAVLVEVLVPASEGVKKVQDERYYLRTHAHPSHKQAELDAFTRQRLDAEDAVLSCLHAVHKPEALPSVPSMSEFFMCCTILNFKDVVRWLLDVGLGVDRAAGLEYAAENIDDDPELLDVLMGAGRTSPAVRLGEDPAPLQEALWTAAGAGNVRCVERLLELGVDPNAEEVLLLQARTPKMLRLLLAHGAEVNRKILVEGTVLGRVVRDCAWGREGNPGELLRMLRILIEAGADVNIGRHDPRTTPLHDLCRCSASSCDRPESCEAAEMLLQNGADVNAANEDGRRALHAAAHDWQRHHHLMKLLLARGADVNVQSREGHAPLHSAIEKFDPMLTGIEDSAAMLLVKHGADMSIADGDGCTPWDLCKRKGWTELGTKLMAAAVLQQKGVSTGT